MFYRIMSLIVWPFRSNFHKLARARSLNFLHRQWKAANDVRSYAESQSSQISSDSDLDDVDTVDDEQDENINNFRS